MNRTVTLSGGSELDSVDYASGGHGVTMHRITNTGTLNIGLGTISDFNLVVAGNYTETEETRNPDGTVSRVVRTKGAGFSGFFWPPVTLQFNPITGMLSDGRRVLSPNSFIHWPAVTPAAAPGHSTVR